MNVLHQGIVDIIWKYIYTITDCNLDKISNSLSMNDFGRFFDIFWSIDAKYISNISTLLCMQICLKTFLFLKIILKSFTYKNYTYY